ncbi:hypothetical protein ACH5A7_17810 [Streptomyces sp. NPDC018955]|uniref:hypothetical protein n=1 Tax=Streptomyces sp. NPDC018955 TaxID=3365055 RepID=UPI0037A0D804
MTTSGPSAKARRVRAAGAEDATATVRRTDDRRRAAPEGRADRERGTEAEQRYTEHHGRRQATPEGRADRERAAETQRRHTEHHGRTPWPKPSRVAVGIALTRAPGRR